MKLHLPTADIFRPDGRPLADALGRVTHLGVGAHQDDLEFMAFHGIAACFHSEAEWFGGVTCTNGAGSARTGAYGRYSDAEMQQIRRHEQRQAAIGRLDGGLPIVTEKRIPIRNMISLELAQVATTQHGEVVERVPADWLLPYVHQRYDDLSVLGKGAKKG